MAAKRILITGASGLLGRDCFSLFSKDEGWQTVGLAFSRAGDKFQKVDITDEKSLSTTINDFKPHVILHSAAERRPDIVEKDPEKTRMLNVTSTQTICKLAKEVGAYVIYISSDYVFDGTKAPYAPTDPVNPVNKYGQSKAHAEIVVLESSTENIVLRVPILYGEVETLDESAVTVLFTKVKDSSKTAQANHRERRYPTHTADVAQAIKLLTEHKAKEPSLGGNFHFSGSEMMTKYDMSMVMAQVFGISVEHIEADTSVAPTGVIRPYDCHLDCSSLDALGMVKRRPFAEGIKAALQKFYP